jgi:hypothetical protein
MAPMGAVGAVLVSSDRALYAHYSVAAQADAGALMWVGSGWALVVATVVAAWSAMVAEERRQRRREQMAEGRGQRAVG